MERDNYEFNRESIIQNVKDEVLREFIFRILKNSNWSVEEIANVLEVDVNMVIDVQKMNKN
ncbi:hypothetical protein [Neobacillus niacini]|uniref:hypothetical protein n=1 Tax=Neobacillus niacini TaxID=86668 RepID=UPI002855C776|nr:hypothetical protein [Neobacillus niacini]MDR7000086.1 hypothetical protein [Neobacillus niacini]